MPDVRLIDADTLCRKIIESIRQANEWENEAREKKDTHGVKCAIDTRRALLSMLSRVQEEPTIDAQPVKHGKWYETHCDLICGVCKWEYSDELPYMSRNGYDSYYEAFAFCPHCGSRLSPPDGAVYEIEDFGGDADADS